MTRRNFIRGGGRIFIIGLMLCGVGFLAIKRRVSLRGYCGDNCASCGFNAVCREPQRQKSAKDGKQST